jgi:hypothetical protein
MITDRTSHAKQQGPRPRQEAGHRDSQAREGEEERKTEGREEEAGVAARRIAGRALECPIATLECPIAER